MGCANCREKTDKTQNATQVAQKPRIYFILGAEGSESQTLCNELVKKFGFVQLSIIEMLQNEQKELPETELSQRINKNNFEGKPITSLRNKNEKYLKQIKPVLEFYESQGKLIQINAESDPETMANVVGKKFK